jgi:hypothetical protein
MCLLTTDHDKRFVAGAVHIALGGVALYPALPGKKPAMEMTEYGKP